MVNHTQFTKTIALEQYGIKNAQVKYQLSADQLHDITIEKGQGKEASSGALAVNTGEFTGRSPMDRFIVKDSITEDKVWWGNINIAFDADKFQKLYDKVTDYLSGKEIFVRDAYACADDDYKLNIRVINEYPWSNMFAYNMFLRPTEDQLEGFTPEWTVVNAPGFMANPEVDGTRQHNFAILDFTRKIALIGGTGYTGEIKKGIFSALNFILPVDEHGWTAENSVFNFEGGCYAKVINLSAEQEPEIYGAIKKGAILENIIMDDNGVVDFENTSITQNTRVSYPIHHIENIRKPSAGQNPKNIFFLTADAFGVLPPISKLTPSQAAYHFISGYTAKVAGTEAGITEPVPSFSACFGAPFMPLHPTKYAEMLSKKMKDAGVNVWLINTGWTGGSYGVGSRIKLKYTRAMINAVLNGDLGLYNYDDYHIHSVFGVAQPRSCPGVPTEVLSPRATWNDDKAYYDTAFKLANAFRENFEKFESYASEEIRRGGPQRYAE